MSEWILENVLKLEFQSSGNVTFGMRGELQMVGKMWSTGNDIVAAINLFQFRCPLYLFCSLPLTQPLPLIPK